MKTDAELIADLGGPAKLAERLCLDKKSGGTQRVHNWITRGIPSKVKVEYPHLFLVELSQSADAIAEARPEAVDAG